MYLSEQRRKEVKDWKRLYLQTPTWKHKSETNHIRCATDADIQKEFSSLPVYRAFNKDEDWDRIRLGNSTRVGQIIFKYKRFTALLSFFLKLIFL